MRWRTDQEGFPPSLLMVASPYDPEVHYAKKQSTIWIGYKVHLTETCDEGGPHLITHVETTPAPVVDRDALEDIHEALEAKGLLPDTHLVDAGYVAADQLVASRKKGVTLLGPAPKDYQWQARSGEGFTVQDFLLDWDREVATCPAGHQSKSWSPDYHQGRTAFKVRFSTTDCRPCPLKTQCTRSGRRLLTLRPREEHETLEAARQREEQLAFSKDVSTARRHRGNDFGGRPGPASAALALYRSCQNASATRADGGCHEPHPTRGLVRWHAARTNAAIRIYQAHDGSHPSMMNSPAVSFSKQVQATSLSPHCRHSSRPGQNVSDGRGFRSSLPLLPVVLPG